MCRGFYGESFVNYRHAERVVQLFPDPLFNSVFTEFALCFYRIHFVCAPYMQRQTFKDYARHTFFHARKNSKWDLQVLVVNKFILRRMLEPLLSKQIANGAFQNQPY